jgi:serine/threonine protein kinase
LRFFNQLIEKKVDLWDAGLFGSLVEDRFPSSVMEPPIIKGYKILAEIGVGSAGVVYEAERADGTLCAIKVFDSMSSNTALLASRVNRVMDGGAQDVTVPVLAQALESRPSCVVMPLMAERLEGEVAQFHPRTLQTFFSDYQANEFSWPFILKLANRLGTLHTIKTAHGNLKPGNIFLGANGGPLMADYASGLMPGVHRLGYSDALLYAPPEQLRHPEGYTEEAAYRWDVYAFGVLAFRLLTGSFPRCQEIFETVSPAPGTQQRFGIEADHAGIAAGLEENGDFVWPIEPEDDREARRREMINYCLSLDPMGRPGGMREVARYFESIEADLAAEEENRRLVANEEKALLKKRGASRRFAFASLFVLGLGGGWRYSHQQGLAEKAEYEEAFEEFRGGSETAIVDLESQRDEALSSEVEALKIRDEVRAALTEEQRKANVELLSAQGTNEKLFDWLLEEGVEGVPTLEGRAERLAWLRKKIGAQLKGMDARPELAGQAGVLRLRNAELTLAMGDVEGGAYLLEEALKGGDLSGESIAQARMRLLLLISKKDPAQVEALLAETAAAVAKAWSNDESRKGRAEAALSLAKARMWEAKGDGEKALASYLQSLNDYKKLEELHPENPAICLMVGRRYLSAAKAAEGEGAFENSAKLRAEAAVSFTALAEKQEHPAPELEYQIASATAARAISQWQQGDTFGSEKLARQGVVKLLALQAKLPKDFRVTVDLASLQGIIATALRDEGNPGEARALLTKSIKSLEEGIESNSDHWAGRYLLASLKWQLSGLMGQQGESDSELEMGAAAHDELKALLATTMVRPHPSEVRKSLAYLCGDLGHSADLRNKRELAVKYLKESQIYWQELARDEGDQLEIREGYHWAKTRLGEMGIK